jgi:hypothetical protein
MNLVCSCYPHNNQNFLWVLYFNNQTCLSLFTPSAACIHNPHQSEQFQCLIQAGGMYLQYITLPRPQSHMTQETHDLHHHQHTWKTLSMGITTGLEFQVVVSFFHFVFMLWDVELHVCVLSSSFISYTGCVY